LRAAFFWRRGNLTQSVILSHVLSGSEGAAKDLTDCFGRRVYTEHFDSSECEVSHSLYSNITPFALSD